jgi:hypothetical protein
VWAIRSSNCPAKAAGGDGVMSAVAVPMRNAAACKFAAHDSVMRKRPTAICLSCRMGSSCMIKQLLYTGGHNVRFLKGTKVKLHGLDRDRRIFACDFVANIQNRPVLLTISFLFPRDEFIRRPLE